MDNFSRDSVIHLDGDEIRKQFQMIWTLAINLEKLIFEEL